ncbi:MAG: RNA pseudouridine synthase [Lachnospiraceae bacterium]|nr:RNA pseudouridine synthase [Lachnospiraceae bacterium]
MSFGLDIIHEDERILVLNKPAGIAVQTGRITDKDLTSLVRNYLSGKGENAHEAEAVHRLDQPVSGLVVFGKNKGTVSRLNKAFAQRDCEKRYYAVVCGLPGRTDIYDERSGSQADGCLADNCSDEIYLRDHIKKDPKSNKAVVCTEDEEGAKEAVLKYRVVSENRNLQRSLLDIQLMTGRFHQIRAQLSNTGFPIVGDVKYGALNESVKKGRIALCAYKLVIKTQGKDGILSFELKPESPAIVDFKREWFYTDDEMTV